MGCHTWKAKKSANRPSFDECRNRAIENAEYCIKSLKDYIENPTDDNWIVSFIDFSEKPELYIRYFNRLLKIFRNGNFKNKKIYNYVPDGMMYDITNDEFYDLMHDSIDHLFRTSTYDVNIHNIDEFKEFYYNSDYGCSVYSDIEKRYIPAKENNILDIELEQKIKNLFNDGFIIYILVSYEYSPNN